MIGLIIIPNKIPNLIHSLLRGSKALAFKIVTIKKKKYGAKNINQLTINIIRINSNYQKNRCEEKSKFTV